MTAGDRQRDATAAALQAGTLLRPLSRPARPQLPAIGRLLQRPMASASRWRSQASLTRSVVRHKGSGSMSSPPPPALRRPARPAPSQQVYASPIVGGGAHLDFERAVALDCAQRSAARSSDPIAYLGVGDLDQHSPATYPAKLEEATASHDSGAKVSNLNPSRDGRLTRRSMAVWFPLCGVYSATDRNEPAMPLYPQAVRWVLLAGGYWFPVDGTTFELDLESEWSAVTNTFAYDSSFCSGPTGSPAQSAAWSPQLWPDEDVRRPFGW